MARVLAAAIIALVISVLLGPRFIAFLRRNEFGQHIREEGPERHVEKQGTPTMGGLLIVLAATVGYLALTRWTVAGLTVFGLTIGCAAIGFLDDFTKLTHRRSLGLAGRWKLALLAGVTFGVGVVVEHYHFGTTVVIPPHVDINLSWAWYVLAFVIIAGATNGVNLTDGIDGLAAGTGLIALITFAAMNILIYIRSGQRPGLFGGLDVSALDQAILAGALIGACIGFLWFNAFPAEVFMGDTGAMAIGGALAGFAIFSNTEILLILVGGIFVIEALSVMLQVLSFKYWGRRIFLMAPIHHHFEMKAWSETKIMLRFWIIGAILGGIAFAVYYNYITDFRI
jgi:phospho-N-acetylmuramoyl-pentapeptide-transferase